MLKRTHNDRPKISPKNLNCYVQEFADRHNIRNLGTLAQMMGTGGQFGRQTASYTETLSGITDSALRRGRSRARAKVSGVGI